MTLSFSNIKTKFTIALPIAQNDLIIVYNLNSLGICSGITLDWARHHLVNELKNNPSNYVDKFNKKLKELSPNYIERLSAYQEYYNSKCSNLKLTDENEINHLFDYKKLLHCHILGIAITSNDIQLNFSEEEWGHYIGIKILTDEEGNSSYIIFDPNYGESIPYKTKFECIDALKDLIINIVNEFKLKNAAIYVDDLETTLKNIGIVNDDVLTLTESKQHYKLIDAIINKDISKIFELNKKHNIYYDKVFINDKSQVESPIVFKQPINPLSLAIDKLSVEHIAQLIEENLKLHEDKLLNDKSFLQRLVIDMISLNKLKMPIIDAFINKAHKSKIELSDNAKENLNAFLEFKNLIENGGNIELTLEDDNCISLRLPEKYKSIIKFFEPIEEDFTDQNYLLHSNVFNELSLDNCLCDEYASLSSYN